MCCLCFLYTIIVACSWLVTFFGSRVSCFYGPSNYLFFVDVGSVDAPSVSVEFVLCFSLY
jgi:hypothetical protein